MLLQPTIANTFRSYIGYAPIHMSLIEDQKANAERPSRTLWPFGSALWVIIQVIHCPEKYKMTLTESISAFIHFETRHWDCRTHIITCSLYLSSDIAARQQIGKIHCTNFHIEYYLIYIFVYMSIVSFWIEERLCTQIALLAIQIYRQIRSLPFQIGGKLCSFSYALWACGETLLPFPLSHSQPSIWSTSPNAELSKPDQPTSLSIMRVNFGMAPHRNYYLTW